MWYIDAPHYSLSLAAGSGNFVLKPSVVGKGVNSLDEWMDAFLVFASVYLELLKYASIITQAYRSFGGLG